MRVHHWLAGLYLKLTRPTFRSRVRSSRHRSLAAAAYVEQLEPRQLLTSGAAAVGFETRVNTYTPGNQISATSGYTATTVASDSSGDYVITWASNGQDGSGYGIYAQRYNSSGIAQGSEFRVNTYTTGNQIAPSVAMDSAGDFVITWSNQGEDGSLYGIYAQRYNSTGIAQGTEFQVNTFTTGNQKLSRVAMDSAGDFVITWQSNGQDGSSYGVYAKRYNSSGIVQGTEFQVNTFTTNNQWTPSVAMDSAGDFVITWTSYLQDGSNYGIYAQRYNSTGAAQGTEFRVNTFTTSDQSVSSVAMDAAGDFVITWQSVEDANAYGVYAQRYNSSGAPQGGEFQVNTYTTRNQWHSNISMDAAGDFAITWESSGQDGNGNSYGVYARQYNAAGAVQGTEFQVNTFTTSDKRNATVAMDTGGDFVITWMSNAEDGSGYGIYAQRYVATVGPIITAVLEGSGSHQVQTGDRLDSAITSFSVNFSDNMNVVSGGVNSVINPSNWALIRYGIDVSNQISGITFGFNSSTNRYVAVVSFTQALTDGGYQLIARQTIQDATGRGLDGEADKVAGGDFAINFYVASTLTVGPETQVNTFTTGNQQSPSVATDAAGDYVVTWYSSGQDGSGYGIYAQRYNSSGTVQGSEFLVNTYTTGNQVQPSVAMDAVGNFVIAWDSQGQDGSVGGIYAQRYNSSGAAQGTEFQVNTYTTGNQAIAKIAMDSAGDFVITWTSNGEDGSGYGVYARRYNSAGVVQGGEIQVNTYTTGAQFGPVVAMDTAGDFVIAWQSNGQDGSGYGIYAQRYNSVGIAQGTEFQVNSYTTSNQEQPSVAMDSAGDFVISWSSDLQDGSGLGIFAQRYTSSGTYQYGNFHVNTYTTGNQWYSAVTMDAAGDFVVAWHSPEDGSSDGVFAQRFNSAELAQGSDFQVNTYTTNEQEAPSIAMDAAGDFVIAWTSNLQDGSNYGIYAQRYKTDLAPYLYNIEPTSLIAAAPLTTPITSSLYAFDQDSNNWTGATVQIAVNYRSAEDVLGFINTNTPLITGSWNSTTGTLTLSGTDTISNYRTALQNVTYHDTSGSPNTALTRTVNFQATDGLLKSNLISRSLTVQASSTPAVISGVSGTGTYFEGDPPLTVAANLVISDPSTVYLTSATVLFTNWQPEDRQTFNNIFALQHNFVENDTNHTGTLTITGTDFVDHYQTLLRSVVYWDVSPNPVTTPRVANFTVSDGLSTSNTGTRNVANAAVNQAPTLTLLETTPLAYKANAPAFPPQPISATLLAGDPDSNNYSTATVKISSGYENDANGTDVLAFASQNGITGSWNAATGAMTLTGTSYIGNYRAALRSVTFSTSGTNVSTANRTISITATDDYSPTPATSLTATRTITVTTAAANLPPALSGIPTTPLAYVRGATALAVSPNAYVYDPDDVNLSSATIQITGNYQNGLDVLAATTVTGITSSFNASTGMLTLSGVASLASYQTVLQSVTFHTTSGANTSTRSLVFIPNDGLANGSAVTRNVTLT